MRARGAGGATASSPRRPTSTGAWRSPTGATPPGRSALSCSMRAAARTRSRRVSGARCSVQVSRPSAHAAAIQGLWRAARTGRLPHAILFEGRAGIGKYLAAKWFAMGSLCARGPDEPCGTCGPCKRVLSGGEHGNHPDLFVLDPEDPFLAGDFERSQQTRIGRIAYRPEDELDHAEYCIERFLDLARSEGGFRPVLIREAQRLNEAAQNALLKTLEEPRAGTVMVLETNKSALLRPPVRSRCIRIRFESPSAAQCE